METCPPLEWLVLSSVGLMVFICHIKILSNEYHKREKQSVHFTTRPLKICSIISIISGTLFGLSLTTEPFPIFCHFSAELSSAILSTQGTFMGFYQLSRLYYCFAKEKVYHDKGYPKWLFILMYSIGLINILHSAITPWIFYVIDNTWSIGCGITDKLEQVRMLRPSTNAQYGFFAMLIYTLWDISTLLLYVFKVISFKTSIGARNPDSMIVKKIQSILTRIIICTVLYEIMCLITMVSLIILSNISSCWMTVILWHLPFGLASIVTSISMYLMQDHNTREYIKLLKIINGLGLSKICCFQSIIDYELERNMSEQIDGNISIATNATGTKTKLESTKPNIDVDMETVTGRNTIRVSHIHMPQLSVHTPP